MALIACPECGKEISSEAKCCPNCGKELKPKTNAFWEKIKTIKKPYLIAITAGIVALAALIIVISSPKTPFDKLSDNPNIETVEKRYGEPKSKYEGDSSYSWDFYSSSSLDKLYYNYKWAGCDGTLEIRFIPGQSTIESASWKPIGQISNAELTKIVTTLNRKYVAFSKNNDDRLYWMDNNGHMILLGEHGIYWNYDYKTYSLGW